MKTAFEQDINAFVVQFSDYVELEALQEWGDDFLDMLAEHKAKAGLILDTNQHNFESIDCLRWLKAFLTTDPEVHDGISHIAFVQPAEHHAAEVVSDAEAYFNVLDDAKAWCRGR